MYIVMSYEVRLYQRLYEQLFGKPSTNFLTFVCIKPKKHKGKTANSRDNGYFTGDNKIVKIKAQACDKKTYNKVYENM